MCRCIYSDREECEPVVKESTQTKQFGFQASGFSFPSIFLSLKYHPHLCIFLTLSFMFFLFSFHCHFCYNFYRAHFLTYTA